MILAEPKNPGSATEGPRADYPWPTKEAADAVNLHPNKFATWWYATRRKLFLLNRTMPRETAAALMRIVSER